MEGGDAWVDIRPSVLGGHIPARLLAARLDAGGDPAGGQGLGGHARQAPEPAPKRLAPRPHAAIQPAAGGQGLEATHGRHPAPSVLVPRPHTTLPLRTASLQIEESCVVLASVVVVLTSNLPPRPQRLTLWWGCSGRKKKQETQWGQR